MRSDPRDYQLATPGTLQGVISLLTCEPGQWLPIAGGTDLMVLYAAGKLSARKLVSIWNLPELRAIEVSADYICIGAGCTYSELRRHEIVARDFPLLASAAAWTGGIANQNRGTLGGNIVNASPAADSLPALLVYDATLILISARGERELPYAEFHIGYKMHALAPDELIRAIRLPRQYANYFSYSRKVGARNAQAISKVCMAGLARVEVGLIKDVRIALGSVAPMPRRLATTERLLVGQPAAPELASRARESVAAQIAPIDDIRSTAGYRAAVAANLVAEFVEQLCAKAPGNSMNDALAHWNSAPPEEAAREVLACCGSRAWADEVVRTRPFASVDLVLAASDRIWLQLQPADWLEAFHSHPRIGESKAKAAVPQRSAGWSKQEQRSSAAADDQLKHALADGNRAYEQKFGHIFIVCATGKSAAEILAILRRRMHNDGGAELREAAEQQRQITQLRLKKWLAT